MSNIITAGNATNNGTSISSDTSGVLELKTGSTPTTAIAVDASQNVTFANGLTTSSNITTGNGAAFVFGAATTAYMQGSSTSNYLSYSTASTERMRIDSSGNLQFNSGYGSVATAYGCRAWVNFNGTGTVAIRSSGNVSSITDNGIGQYSVNFTTAMPDSNYCFQVNAQDANNGMGVPTAQADPTRTITASSLPILYNYPPDTQYYDAPVFTVAIFR